MNSAINLKAPDPDKDYEDTTLPLFTSGWSLPKRIDLEFLWRSSLPKGC
jgi:hypothetical protein